MATTILYKFEGEPELTPELVEDVKEWYAMLQGDCDKASDSDDASYYQGGVDMAVTILMRLYGYEWVDPKKQDAIKKKD